MITILCSFLLWRKLLKKREKRRIDELLKYDTGPSPAEALHFDSHLPLLKIQTILSATNNFSSDNKLGEGGFGPVYKGELSEVNVAVKRLSKLSLQGLQEFKTEVALISQLQHRNLVRLFGCCIYKEEKLLVYEFMPNKSLDIYLFDETKQGLLNWTMRYQIIEGIMRGLLYLHRDSRLKIIHRDLKASNILLDEGFSPKISDFGLARILGGDQNLATTKRVVGTIGYMPPEYAMEGKISEKCDVFSFGVLLLEIISGKKNSHFFDHGEMSLNLIKYAWVLWREDEISMLIDPSLGDSIPHSEVIKCIHVGLLCVQQNPVERPTMSSVISMISGETSLPEPKEVSFYSKDFTSHESISVSAEKWTVNDLTVSDLNCR